MVGIVAVALIVSQTPWFRDWLRRFVVRESKQYLNGELSIGGLSGNLLFGIGLTDVADEDTVAIWNIDGQPGSDGTRGDLQITNTLDAPLRFQVLEYGDGQLVVRASVANA